MMKLSYTILSRVVPLDFVSLTRTIRHGTKNKVGRCTVQHRGLAKTISDTTGDKNDNVSDRAEGDRSDDIISDRAEGDRSDDIIDLKIKEIKKGKSPKIKKARKATRAAEKSESDDKGSKDKEESKGTKSSVKEGKMLSRTSKSVDKPDKKGGRPMSLRQREIEELLGELKLKYQDGYTCIVANCLKFPLNKRPIEDKAIYINKTTGYFTCLNCKKHGLWSDLQKNFDAILKTSTKGKFICFSDEKEYIGKVHDSLGNEEHVMNSLNKGVLLNDVTEKPFSDIQKEFGFQNIFKSIMMKHDIAYDTETKSLLIPYRNPDQELTACRQFQLFFDEDSEEPEIRQSFTTKSEPISLFGWRDGDKEKTKLVLTLTEKDALAVQQNTSDHCVLSVPKESQLPQEVLPYLERFKSVVLWFGCDMNSWLVTKQFARKLGAERCLLFRPSDSCPAPYEALKQGKSLDMMLTKAKPIKHEFITSFSEIREDVLSEISHHEQVSDWTLTEADVQRGCHDNNYHMLGANMLAIKRQEKEFLNEFEELLQQFKEILTTAGINQSQFPVTPNRNLAPSDPMTPTFMCTPKGLTDLDIHKCFLINTLNDSVSHGDGLTSAGSSDEDHSPMSTDTELSDFEDDTVFLEREVEGCENPELDNFDYSMQFSTSFVAGHMANNQMRKKSHDSAKNQGSNPLASSTMMTDKEEPVHKNRKPVQRGVSIPKGSSTLLYTPFPERKVNKSFSPVVKIKDLQARETIWCEKKGMESSNSNNTGSVFTWSLQHSSSDVPLEESYLRSVKKRYTKPHHPTKQMSQASALEMSSRPNLCRNETVYGLSVIADKSGCRDNILVKDCLSSNDTLYSKTQTIPRSSTRMDLQKTGNVHSVQREINHGGSTEGTFKKPSVSSKDTKTSVERKNSVVKKLMRFRESFKRRNGTTDLYTLATL